MSYWAFPRSGHLGLCSDVFVDKQNKATLIAQRSFILDHGPSGLGGLFSFKGRDPMSTMKFKIPATELVQSWLIARGPSCGSVSWFFDEATGAFNAETLAEQRASGWAVQAQLPGSLRDPRSFPLGKWIVSCFSRPAWVL